MRLLHTSDWHLGRSFHRVGLLGAQATFLDSLVEAVRAERVDVVVVAGDVYDRALPSVDVVAVLDDALCRLAATGAAVVVTSGNHDSAQRLGFGGRLLDRAGVHLRTAVDRLDEPVLLSDRWGEVAVYGVPYLEPSLVADALAAERTHPAVLAAAADRVRADLARRPAGTRSVLAAHAFVAGGEPGGSERDLVVGGIGAVPASAFAGVDYVALGHLHGRQSLSSAVRYSGSPLPYSFSEAAHVKGSWLVELGPRGLEAVEPVDAPVHRPLARLRGRLDDLLCDPAHAAAEQAFCQVVLTDPERPRDALDRVRRRFPHALELSFEPDGRVADGRSYAERSRGLPDLDVCCGFLDHVRGRTASPAERVLLAEALGEVEDEPAALVGEGVPVARRADARAAGAAGAAA